MSQVVARKGYGETTIADIAAEARVSKRTFYEHFASKADCLLALYAAASEQALLVLQRTLDPTQDWHAQVEQAMHAYLSTLARNASLLRVLFIEILHMGTEGLKVRRRVNQDIADFVSRVATERAKVNTPLLAAMTMAIVGGINELVLQAIEDDRIDRLADLSRPAAHLVKVVIDGTLSTTASASRRPRSKKLPSKL